MAPKNTERFGGIISDAFAALGVTQVELQKLGGPSDTTLRRIMEGHDVGISVRTLNGLDAAFDWPTGTAARVLAGADPPPLPHRHRMHVGPDASTSLRTSDRVSEPAARPGTDYSPVLASIAVDADDLRDASSHVDTSITTSIDANDPDDVETLIGEVETLISDVDDLIGDITEFADIVDELATKVVGRERLQRMKQDTRRFRRRQYLQQHSVSLFTDADDDRQSARPNAARGSTRDLSPDVDGAETNSQDTVGETPETGAGVPPPPTDNVARRMTDEEIRSAAAADPLWADYVRTKRPELAEDWTFE
ncbi:hypothetical protein [Mycolicibacter algericus]|uniref:Immunity repressor n=1 Tax=Mycolicibacter algericus TaxID=1288388 RepID=A0A7I9Y3W2_MYCAL|nr:hypothetical protein [Mycolicibacter algericus]GFG83350.1 hypothetical protein MALGJ_00260 [Mycolicibacter algericus]